MKSIWVGLVAASLLTAALSLGAQKQDAAERQLKAAMNTEQVDGNLKAAIEQYKKLAQNSNRAIAAQALLHMADCYQKLGDAESRKIYEQIVRDYGDQAATVTAARAHLESLGAGSRAPRVRQVWAGDTVDDSGSLSPDGRFLTFSNWDTGDLGLRDLVNNTTKLLTNTGGWVKSGGDFAQDSRFSPDGKKIAYNWFSPGSSYRLRVMNADGTGVQDLGWNKGGEIVPLCWSADSSQILAYYYGATDGLISLYLVNALSGESREILPAADVDIKGASFSPDGSWIVLDLPGSDGSQESDIYILPVGGGKPDKLEANPAHDIKPTWSTDGNSILFMSNRAGSWGLWRLPLRNRKASGPAQLLRGELGNRVNLIGVSRSGALLYSLNYGGIDVYTAGFDPGSAKRTSEPALVSQRYPGNSFFPQASQDGRSFAYAAQTGSSPDSGGWVVVVRDQTGKEKVHPVAPRPTYLGWTPDSKKILVEAIGQRPNARELLWMDPESGAVTPFKTIEPTRNPLNPTFSPDGRTIYIDLRPWIAPNETWQIMAIDVATGTQRELYKTDHFLYGLALSPDGRTLATIRQRAVWNTRGEQDYELVLVPAAGGATRVAATLHADRITTTRSFTPDGKRVLVFRSSSTPGNNQNDAATIDLATGRMEPVDLRQNRLNALTIDSSGKQLVFSAGSRKREVWIAENILNTK
jgi:Tol biopolymer transport system component